MRLPTLAVTSCLLISHAVGQDSERKQLTDDQIRDGWIALFDGATLYGWRPTSNANWTVENGEIRANAGSEGFLMTTGQWADYELHVEFKAPRTTNSGVFLRTPWEGVNPAGNCYELNIAPPDNPFPTGSFVARQKASLNGLETDVFDGRWHAFDVVCNGDELLVSIDGQALPPLVDTQATPRGRIGLQFREGEIAFRNVRLKPLGLEAIFDGESLSGWNADNAQQSTFDVTDAGELRVVNGRGQLESDGRYGDFVLQLECYVNGDQLNSGIFFRCIPGEFTQGYECQIHNGAVDGDPTQPVDCGTGGFYRRQNARRVVARDREWFLLTLLADGPHMAAWVNGQQVSDWTDQRDADDNPRRGLRTAPGTLAIQGHDPTTDLRFRNLRIVELPAAAP